MRMNGCKLPEIIRVYSCLIGIINSCQFPDLQMIGFDKSRYVLSEIKNTKKCMVLNEIAQFHQNLVHNFSIQLKPTKSFLNSIYRHRLT